MKTHLYHAVVLAGVIGFGAAPGRGQTLIANIPFAFQTSNAEMPPGEYSVRRLQLGSPAIVLDNRDVHKSDIILTLPLSGVSSNTRPRMIFQCSENHCALAEIWGVTSGGGVQLWEPRVKGKEREHLAVLYLQGKPAGK
jgi:hypothetical protein